MTDLKPCPSCREPLDHPSGDGCANMTAHKERAVGDDHLVWQLRNSKGWPTLGKAAAARIEALTEQLTAAQQDAKEAEAYAEDLEKELNTCRMAQAVMDNTVDDLEAKLAKAVGALDGLLRHEPDHSDTLWQEARPTLAEIKGESHE